MDGGSRDISLRLDRLGQLEPRNRHLMSNGPPSIANLRDTDTVVVLFRAPSTSAFTRQRQYLKVSCWPGKILGFGVDFAPVSLC
jgi:hypothetical protein